MASLLLPPPPSPSPSSLQQQQREEFVGLLLHQLDGRQHLPLHQVRSIHARIINSGHDRDTFIRNLLVQMYGRCGSVADACSVFDATFHKSTFTWNTMMVALVQNRCHRDAVHLLNSMHLQGVPPSELVFATILSSCSTSGDFSLGNSIYARAQAAGLSSSVVVANAAIVLYGRWGRVRDARLVFDGLQGQRSSGSWSAIIVAYAQNEHLHEALELVESNDLDELPALYALVALISACSRAGLVQLGRKLHSIARHSNDPTVWNSLVDMYAKCGSVEDSVAVFEGMRHRTQASWNVMVGAYVHHGLKSQALRLFRVMDQEGIRADRFMFPGILCCCRTLKEVKELHARVVFSGHDDDVVVRNALVRVYGEFDSMEDAEAVFCAPRLKTTNNVVSWSSMIAAYARSGHPASAVKCLRKMDSEGISPNAITFLCLVEALRRLRDLPLTLSLHARAVASGWMTGLVETALIQAYASCGSTAHGEQLFDQMAHKSLVSWSTMIGALVQSKRNEEALQLFHEMKLAQEPDAVCLVSVLGACCGSPALEDGKAIHKLIVERGLESDSAVCVALIDMYSKCGSLRDAAAVFREWQQRSAPNPNVVCWTAMIAAYARHGRNEQAVDVFREMTLAGVQGNDVTFTCLLNACSQSGLLDLGRLHFVSMGAEHGVLPTRDHYSCMADHLARAGKFEEAEDLIRKMPYPTDEAALSTVLGACRSSTIARTELAAVSNVVEPGTYILACDAILNS